MQLYLNKTIFKQFFPKKIYFGANKTFKFKLLMMNEIYGFGFLDSEWNKECTIVKEVLLFFFNDLGKKNLPFKWLHVFWLYLLHVGTKITAFLFKVN